MVPDVFWIAPNLNHYKARFLNRLGERGNVRLTVLAGREQRDMGHRRLEDTHSFRCIDVAVTKNWFAFSPAVYWSILRMLRETHYAVVLMPAEKKHILLIAFLRLLRLTSAFRLVSYNHPIMKSEHARIRQRDLWVSRAIFALYDRVIFYTVQSRDFALARRLLPSEKADYANNTLDTATIWQWYDPEHNFPPEPHILFIGRLVKSKRLEDLLRYCTHIKQKIPRLKLTIIGDGPLRDLVRGAAQVDQNIRWLGAISDEQVIASVMREVSLVFVPGLSGLSIVHAFAYGKPYVTIKATFHGPEINYLIPGYNGQILSGDCDSDCDELAAILLDEQRYLGMSRAAFETANRLSIEKWTSQMEEALLKAAGRKPFPSGSQQDRGP